MQSRRRIPALLSPGNLILHLGLVLLAAALLARALRPMGLALEPFPPAAQVTLSELDLSLGAASLRGRVVAQDGRPVGEALVKLVAGDEPVWTYSDAEGRFELAGIPAGPQRVLVWSRRHPLADFEVGSPAGELELVLAQAWPETESLPALERAPLQGVLAAALGGQVLRGYEVVFQPLAKPDAFGAPIERRALAAADRSFQIPDLILGEYGVAVRPPWARGGSWPDLAAGHARTYLHTRAAAERELSVPLGSGELHGRVLDEEGRALEDALVLAHPSGLPEQLWPPGVSDVEGNFCVRDLPPGAYELELSAGEARARLHVEVESGASVALELPSLVTRSVEEADPGPAASIPGRAPAVMER